MQSPFGTFRVCADCSKTTCGLHASAHVRLWHTLEKSHVHHVFQIHCARADVQTVQAAPSEHLHVFRLPPCGLARARSQRYPMDTSRSILPQAILPGGSGFDVGGRFRFRVSPSAPRSIQQKRALHRKRNRFAECGVVGSAALRTFSRVSGSERHSARTEKKRGLNCFSIVFLGHACAANKFE